MRDILKIISFLGLVFFASLVSAAQKTPDVRLLIDVSGSMNINDPEKLRVPSIQLLANLLPETTEAGIWTFGTSTKNLMQFGKANTAWKKSAVGSAKKITSKDLYTDIEAALKRASFDINRVAKDADKNIILLSDGMVDISKSKNRNVKQKENQAAKDRLLKNTLPKLVRAGYKIHTIALSADADKDLLNTLAQKTGGLFGVAKTSDELLELFIKALQRSIPQEEVPIDDKSMFLIDNSIIEFTVLAFHDKDAKPVKLQSADGKIYSSSEKPKNISWYSNKQYDLITVKKPIAGDWKLLSKYYDANRVTVVSNLKMQASEIAANIQRGDNLKLEVWFEQDGKKIQRQEFLNILKVNAELESTEYALKTAQLNKAENATSFKGGLFNLNQPGDFTVVLNANGKTFSRTLRVPVRVQDLITANLQQGDGFANLTLRSEFQGIEAEKLNIDVVVGTNTIQPVYRGNGEWNADLSQLISDRAQTVKVNVTGELVGKNLNMILGTMQLKAKEVAPIENTEQNTQAQETANTQTSVDENNLPVDTSMVNIQEDTSQDSNAQVDAPVNDETAQAQNVQAETAQAQNVQDGAENQTSDYTEQASTTENIGSDDVEESSINAKADSAKTEEAESEISEPEQDKGKLLWLYLIVGLGNIILFAIAFIVYRKFVQLKREEILND